LPARARLRAHSSTAAIPRPSGRSRVPPASRRARGALQQIEVFPVLPFAHLAVIAGVLLAEIEALYLGLLDVAVVVDERGSHSFAQDFARFQMSNGFIK